MTGQSLLGAEGSQCLWSCGLDVRPVLTHRMVLVVQGAEGDEMLQVASPAVLPICPVPCLVLTGSRCSQEMIKRVGTIAPDSWLEGVEFFKAERYPFRHTPSPPPLPRPPLPPAGEAPSVRKRAPAHPHADPETNQPPLSCPN